MYSQPWTTLYIHECMMPGKKKGYRSRRHRTTEILCWHQSAKNFPTPYDHKAQVEWDPAQSKACNNRRLCWWIKLVWFEFNVHITAEFNVHITAKCPHLLQRGQRECVRWEQAARCGQRARMWEVRRRKVWVAAEIKLQKGELGFLSNRTCLWKKRWPSKI